MGGEKGVSGGEVRLEVLGTGGDWEYSGCPAKEGKYEL